MRKSKAWPTSARACTSWKRRPRGMSPAKKLGARMKNGSRTLTRLKLRVNVVSRLFACMYHHQAERKLLNRADSRPSIVRSEPDTAIASAWSRTSTSPKRKSASVFCFAKPIAMSRFPTKCVMAVPIIE